VEDPSDSSQCQTSTASIADCKDKYPAVSDPSHFYFAFWSCKTPSVETVDVDNGTTNSDIVVTGVGFSTINCRNEITFGDYSCSATSSFKSNATCRIDISNSPEIGRPGMIQFRVNNMGFANIKTDLKFALLPLVLSIAPTTGSLGGGTWVVISGTGFIEGSKCAENIDVTFGGYQCVVKNCTYTSITCISPPSSIAKDVNVLVKIAQGNVRVPSICESSCNFTYTENATPTITGVTPQSATGETTTLTINGTMFGTTRSSVTVSLSSKALAQSYACNLTSAPIDTEIQCSIENLPVGNNNIEVHIIGKGIATGNLLVTSVPTISNISPDLGSVHGGTSLTVSGNGFLSDTTVKLNSKLCAVSFVDLSKVVCSTPSNVEASVAVVVKSNSKAYPQQIFSYNMSITPSIGSISPTSGTRGTTITITGTNFESQNEMNHVFIENTPCNVTSSSPTKIECVAASQTAGTHNLFVDVTGIGKSNMYDGFTFETSVVAISPTSGSMAGLQTVTITGTGFEQNIIAMICNEICKPTGNASTTTQYVCLTPEVEGNVDIVCNVTIIQTSVTKSLTEAFTYSSTITPSITSVAPTRGGTAGGTVLTISGTNFGVRQSQPCPSEVSIDGSECNITSWTNTVIKCVTESHQGSMMALVRVVPGCNGQAKQ
ncbi:fibrocystin-L-like, partial [Mizuhopecten yessoensis]|uniref:fibrocystin-L-like n=1 Tax=Mizuhopecten yessoensis TaxID=6573 RepID=UPI000B45B991